MNYSYEDTSDKYSYVWWSAIFFLILGFALTFSWMSVASAYNSPSGQSISISGPAAAVEGNAVQYEIDYQGVLSTGGVQYAVPDGFTVTGTTPANSGSYQDDDGLTVLLWSFGTIGASGTIQIDGTYETPATCGGFDVVHLAELYDTHEAPGPIPVIDATATTTLACVSVTGPAGCEEPDVWSVGSGNWNGGAQWNTGQVPDENDVVWVRPGNQLRVFGLDTLRLESLCNQGTIFSHVAHSLIIEARDFVTNYPGGILRGLDGEPTTGGQGSTIIIQSPISDTDGIAITNRGQILAGNGAVGPDFGGGGGSVALLGNYVENSFKGTITAGRGGSLTGTDSGMAGHGGSITIWSSEKVKTRHRITAGNGGNSNPGAGAPQDGGDAGCLYIMGSTIVDVRWSRIRAGRPGHPVAGGFRGDRCGVFIDPPDTIELSGADIEGDVVELYGGNDTAINASGGITATTVISASQGITLAVGTNGTIDLSNNANLEINVTGENAEVVVASDNDPTLDDGDTLDDVVNTGTAVDEASQILRHLAVVAPEVTGGALDVPLTLNLAILNNGPDQDSYNVTFEAKYDWPRTISGLSNPLTVDGLSQHEFQMTVTPTNTGVLIATEIITITAISTDGVVIGQEITHIQVKEDPPPTAISQAELSVTTMYNWLWLLPAMLLLLLLAAGLMASWRLVATRVK